MKTTRTRAIVLRRLNYGEADRIIHLLTPQGRINVIARGVRREKSKLAGGIELFAVSDVVIGQGKGDLKILTSARLVEFYRHILDDYDRMQFGYETLKQVAKASETLDETEWYDTTAEILQALNVTTIPLSLIQIWFYLRVCGILGYELNTQRDYKGEMLLADMKYRYDAHEKGFVQSDHGEVTAEHIKILRLVANKPLQTLVQIGGMGRYLPECLYVARMHAAI